MLPDGCSTLTVRRRPAPRSGPIYVVRSEERVVSRARRDSGRWTLNGAGRPDRRAPAPRRRNSSAKSAGSPNVLIMTETRYVCDGLTSALRSSKL